MNRLIIDDKERINQWLYRRVGRSNPFGPINTFNAVGIEDEQGNLIGGVVFDSFDPGARCSMHCAGERSDWCSRKLLRFCFDYVFNVARCKVVVITVLANNTEALEFNERVGFKELARVKDGAGDQDLVILTLHRDDCKWVRG